MQNKESLTSSISSITAQLAGGSAATPPSPQSKLQSARENTPGNEARINPGNTHTPHSVDAPPPSLLRDAPPLTPRRMSVPNRLSVQMPSRGPLSPVLDPALGFSVARRPRLDFARACTSLHHSTLAESSPDSSPLASNGYPIPPNCFNRALESPISSQYNHTASYASSLGSTSMLDYPASADDSSSSTDDDLDVDLDFDTTPLSALPMESAASLSLLTHQKARHNTRSPRKQIHPYHPGSGLFIAPSPTLRGPPFFPQHRQPLQLDTEMRRDISLGPSALEISGKEPPPPRPEPLRRPVSRRGSLLPKTKNFQRIKAALIEESCPVDVEVKREAEITRQIREEDEDESTPSDTADITEAESAQNTQNTINEDIGKSFSKEAQRHGGFWFGEQMEGISRSPPVFPTSRHGSDGDIVMNSDSAMNSPVSAVAPVLRSGKRRRGQDDFFEPASALKRRAVSPGVCGSPILAQSPPNSGRRINFQGMNDTHDGLMKMSLQ